MKEPYEALQPYLIQVRRDLHQIPEIGLHLPQTASYVMQKLDAMDIPYVPCQTCSGIVATIQGAKPGKVIALRADMDALPIKEETGLSFASSNGNMHACGHDTHTAMLLGAAKLLNEQKDHMTGSVKLLFQPAEEICQGARAMVKEGVLENPRPDAFVSLHIGSLYGAQVPLGSIGIVPGSVMASNNPFYLKVKGYGCHGSTPEKGVDPISIAAHIITTMQTVVSRELSAIKSAVVSFCKIDGGFTYNIIPDEVRMEGTVRTMDPDTCSYVFKRIEEISNGVAETMRGQCEVEIVRDGAPAVINNDRTTKLVADAAIGVLGSEKVVTAFREPIMTSEDVSVFMENVPGTFMFLGSANPAKHTDAPHHNCKFDVDEDVLWEGSAVFVEAVKKLQQEG